MNPYASFMHLHGGLHVGFAFSPASSSARVLLTASAVKVLSQLRNNEPVFVYLILNCPLRKSPGMTCRLRGLGRVVKPGDASFDSLLGCSEAVPTDAAAAVAGAGSGGKTGCGECWCCCADLGAGMVMPVGAVVVVAATAVDAGA